MDFEKIQLAVQEKILTLGELLDASDRIAKGEERPKFQGQLAALKMSIDARLRLIALWKPQQMDMNITSPVKIIYDRLSEEVSRLPVAGSQE